MKKISFFFYLISMKRNIKNVQQFVNLSILSISNFIISIGIRLYHSTIFSHVFISRNKNVLSKCVFFLIRRICFSPYVRLLLVISNIASRPKICVKFSGLYKLVRSPIGICFFIRENIHTYTRAHIHGGNSTAILFRESSLFIL